jgi:DNA-binding CsgD family transcriptional regulator
VATQLARSAEPGDREAINALRQAAQSVGHSDASAAADLSRRALELLAANDAEHGLLVAETVGLLNRASRYAEAEELAVAALEAASPQEEAEIRLRLPTLIKHSTQRRVEENRRALQLGDISEVTRARHLAWLAYNLALRDQRGQRRAAANEAAAAAASTGDLEATILANVTLALLDCGEGYTGRALGRLEELCALARTGDATAAHDLVANHYALLLAVVGRLDDAAARVAEGIEHARREGNAMALDMWATLNGMVHLAAGRLSAARAATESLARPERTGASEPDMARIVILAEVAEHTDDRTLLQQMVNDARDAYSTGSSVVDRGTAYVLALAAWQRDDVHDAMRWLGDITLFDSPLWPQVLDQVILGARVASAAGDAGLRARVLQATELLERERPAIPLFTGVAGYARGILECDAQALLAAADVLQASSRPLLYAAAAEDAGAELAYTDHPDKAVHQLNAAFDTYMEHEALADARRVGRQLRRLGVQRRIVSHPRAKTGWDSLTDSELTVVNLIAQGVTNRDVATQLHLSLHTVKNHVHNAFTKLGINSRAQLTQLMPGSD